MAGKGESLIGEGTQKGLEKQSAEVGERYRKIESLEGGAMAVAALPEMFY